MNQQDIIREIRQKNDIVDIIPDNIDLTINSVVVKIDITSHTCDNHFTIV